MKAKLKITRSVRKRKFVYFADDSLSHVPNIEDRLRECIPTQFHMYVVGEDQAALILDNPQQINVKRLLVFMGPICGEVRLAISLALKIKRVNPRAQVIFRSSEFKTRSRAFDGCITKDGNGNHEMFKRIKKFMNGKGCKRN